jgi:RNA polymerase sigma-70 factor (ECF subfamily)
VNLNEQELIQKILEGHKEAFQVFYRLYKKSLIHTCWCFLGNDSEVEQVVRETFAKAIRTLTQFKSQCSLNAWLNHIAAGLCRQLLEKNKKHLLYSVDFFIQKSDLGSKKPYPEDVLKFLREEMDQLQGQDKELITQREIKGWPYEAVANHHKIPVGTAVYGIFQIRQQLMEKVKSRLGDRLEIKP